MHERSTHKVCSCQALVELHSKGVAYRDLKASNVMLDSSGDVKLVDFGSSKMLATPEDRIADVTGSPHWTAPEVFKCLQNLFGDPGAAGIVAGNKNRRCSNASCVEGSYDVRADVWSLGESCTVSFLYLTIFFVPKILHKN